MVTSNITAMLVRYKRVCNSIGLINILRFAMSKLVRDKIPEIVTQQGKTVTVRQASEEEYWHLLLHKLHEEIVEFTQEPGIEELSDIMEVVLSLAKYLGINQDQIEAKRKQKKLQRGGFDNKFILKADN